MSAQEGQSNEGNTNEGEGGAGAGAQAEMGKVLKEDIRRLWVPMELRKRCQAVLLEDDWQLPEETMPQSIAGAPWSKDIKSHPEKEEVCDGSG